MVVSAAAESDLCASPELTGAELRQVLRHQAVLSEKRGDMVAIEEAQDDWLRHFARSWREERHRQALAMQMEEIRKHKWIESEKANRDLGNEAVLDWIKNHAARWRAWYELGQAESQENC